MLNPVPQLTVLSRISNHLVSAMGDEEEGLVVPSRTLLLQLMAKLPEETQASWTAITTGRLQVNLCDASYTITIQLLRISFNAK